MIDDAMLRTLHRIEYQLAEIISRLDALEARADLHEAIALGDTPPADGIPLAEVPSRLLARRQAQA